MLFNERTIVRNYFLFGGNPRSWGFLLNSIPLADIRGGSISGALFFTDPDPTKKTRADPDPDHGGKGKRLKIRNTARWLPLRRAQRLKFCGLVRGCQTYPNIFPMSLKKESLFHISLFTSRL